MFTNISGLSDVVDRYDGYIIDLWGTVHNGIAPFEGSITCLDMLKKRGKKVVLLSTEEKTPIVS